MKTGTAYAKAALAVFASAALGSTALAQAPIVYPKKGQSQAQMEKDRFDCQQWAKSQTGFDPMAATTAAVPPSSGPTGHRVRGAASGAAVGAIGGAIAGDAGKGAAIGAASGTVLGGMRKRKERRAQEEQVRAQSQAVAEQRAQYDRAFAACMDGRGYSVK